MRFSNWAVGLAAICLATAALAVVDDDPYIWLSEINSEKTLA